MQRKIVIAIACIMSISLNAEIAFTQIKGLYHSIDKKYKQCSPLHGFNWFKTGRIESFYRYGDDSHNTIKLVRELFYLHRDDVTFDCASLNSNPARYFTASTIGKIIALIDPYTMPLTHDDKEGLARQLRRTITADITFNLSELQQKSLNRIVKHIVGSLNETNRQLYTPYTTHMILLSFLWKMADSKEDFLIYFKQFPEAIISISDEAAWLNAVFTKESYESFFKKIDRIMENSTHSDYPESSIALDTLFLNNYELSSFASCAHKIWDHAIPPIISSIGNATITIKDNQYTFCDSSETALRNLFNILIFRDEDGILDFSLLEKMAKKNGLTLAPSLVKFYKEHHSLAHIETKAYHDAWAQLVSKIPGVTYKHRQGYQISGGLSNMFAVLNYLLLGSSREFKAMTNNDKLSFLIRKLSRTNFELYVHAQFKIADQAEQEPESYSRWDNNTGSEEDCICQCESHPIIDLDLHDKDVTLLFEINGYPEFKWKFKHNHFFIPLIKNKITYQENFISNNLMQLLKEVTSNKQGLKLVSLLGWYSNSPARITSSMQSTNQE